MRIFYIILSAVVFTLNIYAGAAYGTWLVNGIAALACVWAGSVWWRAAE